MTQTPTPEQRSIPIPIRAVVVAEKLFAAHTASFRGMFPLKKDLDVANAALRQKWVDLELPEQIEDFFSTKHPHTKEEAEAFLRYAQRTIEGLEKNSMRAGLEQTLREKPDIPGEKI
jgi:hypothetical protein